MYRFVDQEQRPSIRTIAGLVHQEYPKMFESIKGVLPHVSILGSKSLTAFTRDSDPDVKNKVWGLRKQIYRELQPKASALISASCVSVDYFTDSLAIVLDNPTVSAEIDHAYESFELVVGKRFRGNRSPHITLGSVSEDATLRLRDRILDSTAEACSVHLPEDRMMALGGISLRRWA